MKSKKFRVARSGPTIDGREITPEQIDQMAESYDPNLYGARVWIEHTRSMLPNGAFRAMGDVITLSAVDDGDQRALYAEVDPTDELIQLAKTRQKTYWSIEIVPDFAKTGKAYMAGLSITDSPASLSTEMIKFAIRSDKADGRLKDNLFSGIVEGSPDDLTAEDAPADDRTKSPSLFARVKDLLHGKAKADDARFDDQNQAILEITGEISAIRNGQNAFARTDDLAALRKDFVELTERLSAADSMPSRPAVSGATTTMTDC